MSWKHIVGEFIGKWRPHLLIKYYLYTRSPHYEPELWLVPKLATRDSIAVDVGGNVGIWCLQMSRFCGEVHTFEPNPMCIASLERGLPRKAKLHRVALSDKTVTAQLRFDPHNTGIGTIEVRNTLAGNPGIREIQSVDVSTAKLDDFNLRGVSLIKIDVEGHEEAVIAGALETIELEKPAIICEIEERHNTGGFARVRALLFARGYTACAVERGRLRKVCELEAEGQIPLASHLGINNFVFLQDGTMSRLGCR